MPSAGRLGYPRFPKGVLKVLAGEAHHEGATGSKLPCSHERPAVRWRSVDEGHAGVLSIYVLVKMSVAVNPLVLVRGFEENGGMSESRPTLQFDLDLEAVRLLHRSVSFHLEKWPGGPDPREQESLQAMKTLLTAALLEFSLDQDAQR